MLGDLGKLIVAKGFKKCFPKSKKSPDLVTLLVGKVKLKLSPALEIHYGSKSGFEGWFPLHSEANIFNALRF